MMRTTVVGTLAVAVVAAGLAVAAEGDPRIPSAKSIRADVVARGGAQPEDFRRQFSGGPTLPGVCYGGDLITRVEIAPLLEDQPFLVDEALVCAGLGTYWITRYDSRLMGAQTVHTYAGPYPMHEMAGKFGLAKRMRAIVDAHADEFLPAGTNQPAPGPDGELPPAYEDGGMLVALRVPPRNSADMFTEVAIADYYSDLFWARRTGGFAGVDTWIGPFSVPLLEDLAPTEVRPSLVRRKRGGKRRVLTIRREVAGDETARVRRRDYAPNDIRLGDGITVLRVLRADRRRIRVRVRIDRDTPRGPRDVRVKGTYTRELLTVR